MIEEVNVTLTPEECGDSKCIERAIRKASAIRQSINDWRVTRRSIDARKKPVKVNLGISVAYGDDKKVKGEYMPIAYSPVAADARQVIIVGAGPAGYFAALRALELGWKPIVVERGKDADSRLKDIALLNREGTVNPESNFCFGEGGAGTFSDGKLFTRSKKRGNVKEILSLLVQHGADPEILVDSHPHIGSNCLPGIMKNIRKRIVDNGGEVFFENKVTSLIIEKKEGMQEVIGAITESGKEFKGPVILATGHSARDVYRFLNAQEVEMQPKALAIGVRLEHPQRLIDRIQYHTEEGRGAWLPAAEYSFVSRQKERGVYSFCMCPGGVIVPAVSDKGQCVVNGMSASARSSIWANSGMVVEVHPGDIEGFSKYGVFEMMELQRHLENTFHKSAGESLAVPAQRMKDFVDRKQSKTLPPTSYVPGVVSARIDNLLPEFISGRLQEGFRQFGRKAKGFLTNEAMLVGLESRTSSPIRIPRDNETLQHVSVSGLYPCGEGAGYAGGIVSAAIDGRRCMDAIAVAYDDNHKA